MSSSSKLALRVENISKTYKNGTVALKNLSLEVQQGEFFGLLGPNGAGKTTLLSILTSLTRKSSGKAWIHDIDIDKNFPLARSYLGVVPQEFNFMSFEKVIDIILYQAGYYGRSRESCKEYAEELLKKLDLWDKRNSQSRTLSGGMKRRLMIARAMINKPKILILDEPSAGVDVEIRKTMWDYLRKLNQQGTTIILTSHYLEEIEQLCERVAIIQKGKLIRDTKVENLLEELPKENFIFDTIEDIEESSLKIPGFHFKLINKNHLKISMDKGQTLNQIFQELQKQNINIKSMRTESNRLESLFLTLTGESNAK